MSQPTNMKAAKARLERKKYAARVLGVFDEMKHADNKSIQEQRAEVERKARNQQ